MEGKRKRGKRKEGGQGGKKEKKEKREKKAKRQGSDDFILSWSSNDHRIKDSVRDQEK